MQILFLGRSDEYLNHCNSHSQALLYTMPRKNRSGRRRRSSTMNASKGAIHGLGECVLFMRQQAAERRRKGDGRALLPRYFLAETDSFCALIFLRLYHFLFTLPALSPRTTAAENTADAACAVHMCRINVFCSTCGTPQQRVALQAAHPWRDPHGNALSASNAMQ